MTDREGKKFDEGKPRTDLLSMYAVAAVSDRPYIVAVAKATFEPTRQHLITALHALLTQIGGWEPVCRVLMHGAEKYGERNWEAGIPLSRVLAAALRHVLIYDGADDDETGLPHLAHAACEVMFALHFVCEGRKDLDDLPGAGCR